jgi:hypothetical protein
MEDTKRQFQDTEEAAYRSSFVPHAIILTERKVPQPIFIAAVLGVDRLLRVDFDLTKDPATFVEQALPTLPTSPLSLTSRETNCGFWIVLTDLEQRASPSTGNPQIVFGDDWGQHQIAKMLTHHLNGRHSLVSVTGRTTYTADSSQGPFAGC